MNKLAIFGLTLALALAFIPSGAAQAESYYSPYSYMSAGKPVTYSYSGSEQELVQYLIQLIAQLQAQIEAKKGGTSFYGGGIGYHSGTYVVGRPRSNNDDDDNDDDEVDVTTDSADNIEDNEAELRGEVDMNDFEDGEVFFVYGEDEDQIEDVEDDFDSYSDVDEDGDDLQKVKVDSGLDDDEEYEEIVTGLNDDTEYFYQICVGYEDEDDDDVITCGGVEHFETDGNGGGGSSDDEPDATTESATNIESDEADLRGNVDMNDFENGRVFFVYGENETEVEDVEDDFDTYDDVDENGDDLQKVLVDNDLDGSDSYTENVTDLNDDTDHFFQICVEFEDGSDKLVCGGVEEFATDN